MGNVLIDGFIKEDGVTSKGYIIANGSTGIILDVKYGCEYKGNFYGDKFSYDENSIIEAGDMNCHSHPEQSLYTDIVDKSWDLPKWCRNTIYKYSPYLKPEHIYYACCRAFSRMLKSGVTFVMVSFYCHNNSGNLYDREVIRAAIDTGIRIYFGRMNYDIINNDAYEEKKKSQESYHENVLEAEKNFKELYNDYNMPGVIIAPSVHSMHASTKGAILNAVNLGNKYDRLIQLHLSEDMGDVELSKKLYGVRPVELIASLYDAGYAKKLDNVILSDCIWIDENELDLIKKYNMKVVLNTRMNNRVKAGKPDIESMLSRGITIYLGTDGEASNDDLTITGEKNFIKASYPDIPENVIDNMGKSNIKYGNGYVGDIEKGNFCDLKITENGKIKDVFVGADKTVSNGKLVKMNVENDIETPLKKLVNELVSQGL